MVVTNKICESVAKEMLNQVKHDKIVGNGLRSCEWVRFYVGMTRLEFFKHIGT